MRPYATFWQRFCALWIDVLVFVPLMVLFQVVAPTSKALAILLTVGHAFLAQAYFIYGHGRFGKTLGKLVMGIRLVRVQGEPLRWRDAWVRSAFDIALMAVSTLGQVVATVAIADAAYYNVAWRVRHEVLSANEPIWALWAGYAGAVWFLCELVTMLFRRDRRAVHDLIAGTVVLSDRALTRPVGDTAG